MNTYLEEIGSIFHKLSDSSKQEIKILILENRLESAAKEVAELQHHIEVLQSVIKGDNSNDESST